MSARSNPKKINDFTDKIRSTRIHLKRPVLPNPLPPNMQIAKLHWFFKLILILAAGLFVLFLIADVFPNILPLKVLSNTDVSGILYQNQIWQGTIKIQGDVYALPGVTVTIQPGTQILINVNKDSSNMDFLPWHSLSGINTGFLSHGVRKGEPFWDERQKIQIHFSKINAIGTKDLPVIIKSDTQNGSPYDFNVISASNGNFAFVQFSNYRRFEIGSSVIVRNSTFNMVGECAVCIKNGFPTVINNEFRDSFREDIWVAEASPRISDNLFMNKKGVGIRLDPQYYGSAEIMHNTFEMPSGVALFSLSGDEKKGGLVSKNVFSGSSIIVLPCQSNLQFEYNNLLGLISFSKGGCSGSYSFGKNYWGTTNIHSIIMEKIMNKEKGFTVKIPFLLSTSVKDAGRRGS